MKLKKLIEKLQKAQDAFVQKHGKDPSIFFLSVDFDDTIEMTLTSKIKRKGGLTMADKETTKNVRIKI